MTGLPATGGSDVWGVQLNAYLTERAPNLTPGTLHATYGDHFAAGSLDAKWTRVGYVSGDEQHITAGGGWLQVDTARTAANYYYQTAPSGDFTVVAKMTLLSTNAVMFGPMILDSSGAGVCCGVYNSGEGHYAFLVSAGSYASSFTTVGGPSSVVTWSGVPVWYKLRKSGTNYYATISMDGQTWRKETTALSSAVTVARIGFGCIFSTPVSFAIDFFDVQ